MWSYSNVMPACARTLLLAGGLWILLVILVLPAGLAQVPAQEEEFDILTAAASPQVELEQQYPGWRNYLWVLATALFLVAAVLVWLRSRRAEADRRRLRRLALALLLVALLSGSVLLTQDEGADDPGRLRTRSRLGACEFGVEFGLRVTGPAALGQSRRAPFAALRAGVTVQSNGHVELVVRNVEAQPLPGRLAFTFFRGRDGRTPVPTPRPFEFDLADAAALAAFNRRNGTAGEAPRLDAPAGISAADTPINEILRVIATYTPRDPTTPCKPVTDFITVNWTWNGLPDQGSAFVFDQVFDRRGVPTIPPHRSRVESSPHIIDETTGFPGRVNKATQTVVHFSVPDPFACCGQANKAHTIIQFVRHRFKLGNNPVGQDEWNLDGPESQAERRAQNQPYDPTYTTNPAHGGDPTGADNGVVHVGPWHRNGGGPAVVVHDFPGLFAEDHQRFVDAGGTMAWEFVTLLVCLENRGDANHYLSVGMVRAKTHFFIRREYTRGNPIPVVKTGIVTQRPIGGPAYYDPCRTLADVLDEIGLRNAFLNPRSHVIRLQ